MPELANSRVVPASDMERVPTAAATSVSPPLLEQIVENIPDMIFVKDASELRFVSVNRAAERLLGYRREQLIGKNDYDLFPRKEAEFFIAKDREVLSRGSLVEIALEPIHTREHGERLLRTKKVPISDAQGRPRYLLGISEDVTELERTRSELTKANEELIASRMREGQKMELLGVLAGGVAHDFNNLLVGILGNASLLSDRYSNKGGVAGPARQIEVAAQQAAELTQQILAYSGRGHFVVEPVDVGLLVEELGTLLRASVARTAELSVEVERGTWAKGDAIQLRQLVMNLIANASDALAGEPGRVDVRVRCVQEPASEPSEPWDIGRIEAGEHVVVEVRDTGAGMDRETLGRIFEPFFTTKERGHGLGLAAAVGIVNGHGGALRLRSTPGEGSCFCVYLARTRAPVTSVPPPSGAGTTVDGARRKILVVDDEEVVRELAALALSGEGFEVVKVVDGAEAVAVLGRDPEAFDLVILDLSMPAMGGKECLRRLRALRPALRILLSSGYDESDLPVDISAITGFLQKPYRTSELLAAVEGMLEV